MSALRKIKAKTNRQPASAKDLEDAPVLAWPLVCGPAVSARTRALAYRNGVLHVEARDETWRTQLAEFAPTYVAALNQIVSEHVQHIEFVVAERTTKPMAAVAVPRIKPR